MARPRPGSSPQRFRSALSTGTNVASAEAVAAAAEAATEAYRKWASGGTSVKGRCVLVELDFIAEVDGGPVTQTLYLSDRVFFDDVTNNAYIDVIRTTPQFTRSLTGDGLGSYVSSVSALDLDNANGALDFMRDLACDGSQIRFYYGDGGVVGDHVAWPVADFQLIFTAIVAKVYAQELDRMTVALKDTGLLLDKSIGGSTIGGGGPNDSRPRPLNFGYVHNGEAILADPSLLKYVHTDDLTGAAVALEVRDRGVPLGSGSGFNDLGNGVFQVLATPDGQITCDVLSEPRGAGKVLVSDAFDHYVGTMAGLSALGLYAGAGPTFTVGDDDDYDLGVRVPEARNVLAVVNDICASGNCFPAVTRLGLFTFGRLRLNDIASLGLDARTIYEDDYDNGSFSLDHASTGYYKFQAFMSRNWTKQTDLASSLLVEDAALYTRDGLYVVQPDGLTNAYADRPELYHKTLAISPVIPTLISKAFAVDDVDTLARWMTTRRAAQLPWVEIVKLTAGIEWFDLELGEPVWLVNPRFGEDDGVLFQVIGITINLTAARCELTLARRNVIQAVPDAWRRQESAIDDAFAFSGADPEDKPDVITLIDITITSLIPTPTSGDNTTNRKWIPGRGIIITRPKTPTIPTIFQSVKVERTSTFGTTVFNFTAASAGDFLVAVLCNVTSANVNTPAGWSSAGGTFSSGGATVSYFLFYKVAVGGESTVTFQLFSGSGMKSGIFMNVRGTDGVLYSHTTTSDHAAGTSVSAPVLTAVPAGALAVSAFVGGDDFLNAGARITCTVSGDGWAELQDAGSNIASSDQGNITVATRSGTGTLPAGSGAFSRSVDGHIASSFYLKTP